jgi:hypothetical protein
MSGGERGWKQKRVKMGLVRAYRKRYDPKRWGTLVAEE